MNSKSARNKIIATIGIVAIAVVFGIGLFSSQVSESDRFTGIAAILVFGLAIGIALLNRRFGRSLGRAMRASGSKGENISASAAGMEASEAKSRSAPSQPFTYQVFDMNSTPALSPAAEALLKRAYRYYRGYVTNLCVGALFLWASFFVLSVAASLLHVQLSIASDILCGSMISLLVAFVIANPRRYPTSWTIIIWGALNLIFLAAIVFVAIRSILQVLIGQSQLIFLLGLASGIVAAYGTLFFVMGFTLRRQVSANKPLQLLALWVFNTGNNLVSILSGIGLLWRFLGTIQFLRGGEFTVDLESLMKKKEADLIADTPEKLESGLRSFQYVPGWSGSYVTNTLLCGDAVWKPAIHALLRKADAVAMSLFGFSKSNQGCLYELGLLLDTFPIHRVLFLVDETTDLDFLLDTLRQSWECMATDSPNHTATVATIQIYRLSTRFDRPLGEAFIRQEAGESVPGGPASLKAWGALSSVQSGTAREVDCMLRLILEGVVC